MNKKYKPVIAVAVLVILVAILGIVTHVVMKYIPSSEKMDLNEYYGEMADGEIALVIGTEKLEERGLVDGDRVQAELVQAECEEEAATGAAMSSSMYNYSNSPR